VGYGERGGGGELGNFKREKLLEKYNKVPIRVPRKARPTSGKKFSNERKGELFISEEGLTVARKGEQSYYSQPDYQAYLGKKKARRKK